MMDRRDGREIGCCYGNRMMDRGREDGDWPVMTSPAVIGTRQLRLRREGRIEMEGRSDGRMER